MLSNCFIACAVADLKAHKLTSVQNYLHFHANISVTLMLNSLSHKCDEHFAQVNCECVTTTPFVYQTSHKNAFNNDAL